MKQVNFDSFKRIHASGELIQKAMAIPETVEKTPLALPWYRSIRILAAAACVVLVLLAGVSTYFLFRNKNAPVQTAIPESSGAVPATDEPSDRGVSSTGEAGYDPVINGSEEKGARSATDSAGLSSGQSPTTIAGDPATLPPERQPSEAGETLQSEESTAAPAPTAPSQQGTESRKPNQPSTQTPTVRPTEALPPIQAQTDRPTETATFSPTLPEPLPEPWESNATAEPIDETAAPTEPDPVLTLRTSISAQTKSFHGVVYCRIYDRDRKIVLGDPDRYTASHLAEWTQNAGNLHFIYRPSEHGIEVPPGNYAISFHNEEGKSLMYYYITVS